MAKSVKLKNGRFFKTQKAAKDHFKYIFDKYKNGDIVSNSADHSDLVSLIDAYDSALSGGKEAKAGVGISHFFRATDIEHYGVNDCFFIKRVDGSEIDFSFHKAVVIASQSKDK